MGKRIGMWGFVVAGVAVAVFGVISFIAPMTSCRGVPMGPGDVCETASFTAEASGQVQRYEDRVAVARQQAPFAVAAGLGAAIFGLVLVRRQAVSPIGP